MRRIVWPALSPRAAAASDCPASRERTPERKTSAVVADVHMMMGTTSIHIDGRVRPQLGTAKRKK